MAPICTSMDKNKKSLYMPLSLIQPNPAKADQILQSSESWVLQMSANRMKQAFVIS